MKRSVSAAKLSGNNSSVPEKAKNSRMANNAANNKVPPAPRWVNIDYPRPSEKVLKGHYAIRVHAPWANQAQISFNGTSWNDCRNDVGFFWYDWHPERPALQKIYARARNGAGAWTKAETRECEVK